MELIINNKYLFSKNGVLIEVFVAMVTETSYQLLMDGKYVWVHKEWYKEKYVVIENITKFTAISPGRITQCDYCNNGYVNDGSTSTGLRLCPMCFGTGLINNNDELLPKNNFTSIY